MSTKISAQVKTLIDAGAPAVFVPGLYPKHISPSKEFYAADQAQFDTLGKAISDANDAIAKELAQYGDKAIYYDAFTKMLNDWNSHSELGITKVGNEFCDGFSQFDWDLCVVDQQGNTFYWMQYLDPTTRVHKLLATDMYSTLQSHYGVS